jgi:hypothetical protein
MEQYIQDLKQLINNGNLQVFQSYIHHIYDNENEPNFDLSYLFQKVYLHACLKRKRDIAEWLEKIAFTFLQPIQQIAIRQLFSYGHYLLK